MTERPGYLRLKTSIPARTLYSARNTLTQRMEGPTCAGAISMDISKMKDGVRILNFARGDLVDSAAVIAAVANGKAAAAAVPLKKSLLVTLMSIPSPFAFHRMNSSAPGSAPRNLNSSEKACVYQRRS